MTRVSGFDWIAGNPEVAPHSSLSADMAQETGGASELRRRSLQSSRLKRTGILYNRNEGSMPSETTYSSLRQNLATVLDQVVDQQDTVIVRRRGARDVALIPASELAGLMETAHLLRSPRNARRLMTALRRAKAGRIKPGTAAALRKEMLGEATA